MFYYNFLFSSCALRLDFKLLKLFILKGWQWEWESFKFSSHLKSVKLLRVKDETSIMYRKWFYNGENLVQFTVKSIESLKITLSLNYSINLRFNGDSFAIPPPPEALHQDWTNLYNRSFCMFNVHLKKRFIQVMSGNHVFWTLAFTAKKIKVICNFLLLTLHASISTKSCAVWCSSTYKRDEGKQASDEKELSSLKTLTFHRFSSSSKSCF